MYCINLGSEDPFFNLAIEEVLLKNSKEEYLLLGINTRSVIIGKHQTAHREVNTQFVSENDIPVIRRISGGGTVFHDPGNLNFTFIRQSETGKQVDFRKYTQPVMDFLLSSGVEVKFEGKSDLKVRGLKISGNAEHVYRNRVLHHGTVLFNTSLDMLRNSLRKDTSCYSTRGVKSNPSSVTNLKELLQSFRDIYQFRSGMMNFLKNNLPDMIPCQLSKPETEQAEILASSKYKSWEWNWAYGPEYHFSNQFEIDGDQFSCRLFVKDGIVRECKIIGTFEMEAFSKKLVGCRHMVDDFIDVFRKGNISVPEYYIFNFF
jgi:lipoate-protein ligase A